MAQVSYGTITITDTTDIERIYTVYAKSTANNVVPSMAASSWSESVSSAPGTGNYVWQRTVVLKSGPTSSTNPTYSDPVCLTGEEGTDATQIKNIEVMYGISADWNTQPSSWTANTPAYDSSKPKYWTRTRLVYDTSPETYSTPVYTKDEALTKAVTDAATANSIAQHANEDAQGAMSQAASNINEVKRIWYAQAAATPVPSAPSTEVTTTATHGAWSITKPAANESYPYYFYCDQTKTGGGVCSWSEVILDTSTLSQYQIGALTTKVRNYWWDSAGAHIASGTSTSGEISATSPTSSYGYNTLTGLTGISFRYNDAKVVDLNSTTPSLDFYQPPAISGSTVTQGKKTMMLSANALRFYDPSNGTTEQAKLDTNGLVLSKGGIVAGTKGQTGYIYLSTANHPVGTNGVTINSFTPTSSTEQWREVIGTKFGVTNAGTLYAANAVISGTIAIGSGSTIDSRATVGGTSLSNIAQNASAGAQAASDLSDFETTVSNTYATQEALSNVEGEIPDVSGLAEKSNAVYRTQRIYYRKTSSGAPSKNTTWLASSGTGYGNWSLNIPQLINGTTKYPYLYTAIQTQTITQYNSGATTNNCSCSDVLLDNTTTIIDGGSIIAGSVTANEITGSTLSAIYADLGAITAGSISRGNNSINFNQDAATLEFKNASTWTSATRGIQWTGSDLNIKGNITATSLTLNSGVQIPASTGISGLSAVATSGSYNDLTNKPTIPSLTGYIYVDGRVGSTPAEGATGFVVETGGLLKASNAIIYGTLYSSAGTIGGWTIKSNVLSSSTTSITPGNGVIILSKGVAGPTTATGVLPANQTWAITASNNFGVTTTGTLYATNAHITGEVTATSGSFTGTIHATSGEFNGQITAGSGTIGRWQITSTALKTSSGSTSAGMGAESTYAFWAGNEAPASAPFRVGYDGTLTAVEANLRAVKLQDSSGILRAAVGSSGLTLYDSNGSTEIGKFSNNGVVQIGRSNGGHIYMSANNGLQIYHTGSNAPYISVLSDGISFYKNVNNKILTISMDSSGTAEINSGTSSNYPYRAFFLFHSEIGMDSTDSSGSSIIECSKNSDGHYISMYTSGDINIQAGSKSKTIELTGRLITSNIDCGSVSVAGASGGGIASAEVPFNKTFASAPKVVITPSTSVPGSTVLGFGIGNVSTTKFTIYVNRINSTSTTFHWIAIL